MAIVNRTLDPSEQKKVYEITAAATATSVTLTVGLVPYQANLIGAQLIAWGLSGAPSFALAINRFIAGSGFTTIVVGTGTSNIPAEYGTSGPGAFGASLFGTSGMVLAAVGSTLMQLQANDLLTLTTGVANTAVKGLACAVVIQPTVDIKYHFGTGV